MTKYKQAVRKEELLTVKIIFVLMQYSTVLYWMRRWLKLFTDNMYNNIVYMTMNRSCHCIQTFKTLHCSSTLRPQCTVTCSESAKVTKIKTSRMQRG